jgi:phosphonatase-like hydrolase
MSSFDPTIELVCLDMAGTTVSDDGLVDRAFESALDELGIVEGDPERPRMVCYVAETMGTSKIEVFRALFGDETRAQEANRAFESAFAGLVAQGAAAPLPGARETIDRLRSAGLRVALTTGFSASTQHQLLDALCWNQVADLALSPTLECRGRPHPDMILTAVLRLQISSVAAVAVAGDTASDMASGRRAGAQIVAGVLTGSDNRGRLEQGGASHVLESVRELPTLLGIG